MAHNLVALMRLNFAFLFAIPTLPMYPMYALFTCIVSFCPFLMRAEFNSQIGCMHIATANKNIKLIVMCIVSNKSFNDTFTTGLRTLQQQDYNKKQQQKFSFIIWNFDFLFFLYFLFRSLFVSFFYLCFVKNKKYKCTF